MANGEVNNENMVDRASEMVLYCLMKQVNDVESLKAFAAKEKPDWLPYLSNKNFLELLSSAFGII